MNHKAQDPQTNAEWQEAVDLASALLHLDSARQYGLVTGGPVVNVERCVQILADGAQRGFTHAPDHLERFLATHNQAPAPAKATTPTRNGESKIHVFQRGAAYYWDFRVNGQRYKQRAIDPERPSVKALTEAEAYEFAVVARRRVLAGKPVLATD